MQHNNMSMTGMIIISIVSGMLSGMNLWAVEGSHMRAHLNNVYMVLLMTGWMVLLTTIFTPHIDYQNYLIIGSALVIGFTIYFIRKQVFINDKQFLNGMIPHHSSALLMARRIKEKTKDPRIIQLANNIIKSQTEEIKLMDTILKDK